MHMNATNRSSYLHSIEKNSYTISEKPKKSNIRTFEVFLGLKT